MRDGYGPDWSYRYERLPKRPLVFPNLNLVVAIVALTFFIGFVLGSVGFMIWILSGAK